MALGLTLVIAKGSVILFEVDVTKSAIHSGKITMERPIASAKKTKNNAKTERKASGLHDAFVCFTFNEL